MPTPWRSFPTRSSPATCASTTETDGQAAEDRRRVLPGPGPAARGRAALAVPHHRRQLRLPQSQGGAAEGDRREDADRVRLSGPLLLSPEHGDDLLLSFVSARHQE